MAYEVVMSYHLHMPSYFLGTFTEYPRGNFLEDMMHLFLSFIGNGYNRFEFTCLISTHIRLWCP